MSSELLVRSEIMVPGKLGKYGNMIQAELIMLVNGAPKTDMD
jgi:hypothetical protein